MIKTKFTGVYYRLSEGEKMNGRKLDSCFYIAYKKQGRLIWEKAGWSSEGYSPKLASQIRSERLRTIRHGHELPREKAKVPRFSEMAKKYLEWVKENKSRDIEDKGRYENHLKEQLGNKHLSEISSFDVERLKSNLMKKELAPATIKHCLGLIRQIFQKAREWGFYQGDHPLKGVKMPVLNNKRERFLSHEEADLLLKELAAIKGRATHDQALLALHCGLRAGEIFNLKVQDIDFENGLIRILDPKNNENRTAYLNETVREMLESRLRDHKGEYVFSGRGTTGCRIKVVSQTFDLVVKKLGFNEGIEDSRQRVVFHSLRHTFGSWLAIQGTPILTIRELLGHRSLTMTLRYAHLIPDMKRDATLALEANFKQSRNNQKVIPFPAGH